VGDQPAGPDRVLDALADRTRRRVLELLGEAGEATAGELAGHLPVSRQAVVQHLGVLEAAGLAASRRDGRRVLYRTLPSAIDEVARWMASIAADWDRRLHAIKQIAEDPRLPRPRDEPDRARTDRTSNEWNSDG
jgi:DNA-binding transcriptional ArsR family regulator